MTPSFQGDRKAPMVSPLATFERRLIDRWAPRFPHWIEGYHLTLLTLAWTAGLVIFGWLARGNLHWLWFSSLMLALQWFTDSFDGALGRLRDTGIPKWGYYTDHMLDFLFMAAIFVGYAFMLDGAALIFVFVAMLLYLAMMASSFLSFGVTNEFRITYLGMGPTEVRLLFIALNTLIIIFGVELLTALLPWMAVIFGVGLAIIVYTTQRAIWALDMQDKAARKGNRE